MLIIKSPQPARQSGSNGFFEAEYAQSFSGVAKALGVGVHCEVTSPTATLQEEASFVAILRTNRPDFN
jgi:hypothetical protein